MDGHAAFPPKRGKLVTHVKLVAADEQPKKALGTSGRFNGCSHHRHVVRALRREPRITIATPPAHSLLVAITNLATCRKLVRLETTHTLGQLSNHDMQRRCVDSSRAAPYVPRQVTTLRFTEKITVARATLGPGEGG